MKHEQIPAEVVEATWREVASFSPATAKREAARVHREQPDLAAFVLVATQKLSPGAHELAFYLFLVVWRMFKTTYGRIRPIKAAAVQRVAEQEEAALTRLQGAHERFLERAVEVNLSHEKHVFRYLAEAIMEAPDDPEDPVEMDEHEVGALFLVLSTAVQALSQERERAAG